MPCRLLLIAGALLVQAAASSIEDAYNEAAAAVDRGDFARAAALLQPFDSAASAPAAQLAVARLALARAQLLGGNPGEARDVIARIGDTLDGTPHAGAVSAMLGDALRLLGDADGSRAAYETAGTRAGDGLLGRYAQARLAELRGAEAEQAGDHATAANLYLDAADALLALAPEDKAYAADARALYEKVARGAEWRGEPTARAVFSMGEVERVLGNDAEAIAYYQRTFVSWTRFPKWPARAYLRAAESMDRLGKRTYAIRHLWELMRKRERYGALPEYEQARRQLREWGEEVR